MGPSKGCGLVLDVLCAATRWGTTASILYRARENLLNGTQGFHRNHSVFPGAVRIPGALCPSGATICGSETGSSRRCADVRFDARRGRARADSHRERDCAIDRTANSNGSTGDTGTRGAGV